MYVFFSFLIIDVSKFIKKSTIVKEHQYSMQIFDVLPSKIEIIHYSLRRKTNITERINPHCSQINNERSFCFQLVLSTREERNYLNNLQPTLISSFVSEGLERRKKTDLLLTRRFVLFSRKYFFFSVLSNAHGDMKIHREFFFLLHGCLLTIDLKQKKSLGFSSKCC